MERPAKLARLEKFRRGKPRCSASALDAILHDVSTNGLPPMTDRKSFREARNQVMQSATLYGPILQYITVIDKTDTPQVIPIADPFASLWYFVKECSEENAGFKGTSWLQAELPSIFRSVILPFPWSTLGR